MYEIKENSRILKDGTELTTYTRDVVSANILEVEAGTTGYQGGDSGHGGQHLLPHRGCSQYGYGSPQLCQQVWLPRL